MPAPEVRRSRTLEEENSSIRPIEDSHPVVSTHHETLATWNLITLSRSTSPTAPELQGMPSIPTSVSLPVPTGVSESISTDNATPMSLRSSSNPETPEPTPPVEGVPSHAAANDVPDSVIDPKLLGDVSHALARSLFNPALSASSALQEHTPHGTGQPPSRVELNDVASGPSVHEPPASASPNPALLANSPPVAPSSTPQASALADTRPKTNISANPTNNTRRPSTIPDNDYHISGAVINAALVPEATAAAETPPTASASRPVPRPVHKKRRVSAAEENDNAGLTPAQKRAATIARKKALGEPQAAGGSVAADRKCRDGDEDTGRRVRHAVKNPDGTDFVRPKAGTRANKPEKRARRGGK